MNDLVNAIRQYKAGYRVLYSVKFSLRQRRSAHDVDDIAATTREHEKTRGEIARRNISRLACVTSRNGRQARDDDEYHYFGV